MIEMRFPDGSVIKGVDATDALAALAKMQWQKVSVDGMKHLLAARAYGWNHSVVDPGLPDAEFVHAIGETGMVFVTYTDNGRHGGEWELLAW